LIKKMGILNRVKYPFILVIMTAVILLGGTSSFQVAYAIQTDSNEYGIVIEPEGQLFQISGMAPGCTDHQTLTVNNEGQKAFTYRMKVITNDQENILYQALVFKVTKADQTLYAGKLQDLNLVLGSLMPGGSETFDLSLGLPPESGNEYESQEISFDFLISAEGYNGGNNGGENYTIYTEVEPATIEEEPVNTPTVETQKPDALEVPQDTETMLPLTGVASAFPYYAVGSVVVAAGIFLIKKKKS